MGYTRTDAHARRRRHSGHFRPGTAVLGVASAVLLLCAYPVLAGPRLSTGTDAEAQLPYWELADAGMSLRLVQRLPDQTRGFFMARGFGAEDAELIAQSCVFQTVFKNISHEADPSPLAYNLGEWVVHHRGGQGTMLIREHWRQAWPGKGPPQAARIALEWALLPTEQRYDPGDYNWGMSVFGLRPGETFTLEVVWHQHGQRRTRRIEGIECAADIPVDPVEQ